MDDPLLAAFHDGAVAAAAREAAFARTSECDAAAGAELARAGEESACMRRQRHNLVSYPT